MSQLDRFAAGEHFDIHLSGTDEYVIAAYEREHASIGGKRRVYGGVSEEGQLLPIDAGEGRSGSRKTVQSKCPNQRDERETR
jgi:hypothetical protein